MNTSIIANTESEIAKGVDLLLSFAITPIINAVIPNIAT